MRSTVMQQSQSASNDGGAPLAIYIHWPFCKKKCPYCDFNSHVREQVAFDQWQQALRAELAYWHAATSASQVVSIFFGGGTPSLMPPAIAAALIDDVVRLWRTAEDLEITLEANPTSVEAANFAKLSRAGVNRFSLGIQSLRDASLKFLGREHSVDEARSAIALAAKSAPRYSFDLIYALPDQTEDGWARELEEALALGPQHLSLYQLTIEENTAFHHAYHHARAFDLPDDERAARLYELTGEITAAAGLNAYEISNYAAAAHACRHNLAYWRGEAYLGIGPGAHGRVHLAEGRLATHTIKSPERWLSHTLKHGHGLEHTQMLSAREGWEEQLLMGLRLTEEGVALPPEIMTQLTGVAAKLAAHDLLHVNEDRLRITPRGALVLNAVVSELVMAMPGGTQ